MSAPDVVLVTGSRRFQCSDLIHERLRNHKPGTILIHGGCRGADTMCAQRAGYFDFQVWELPYFEVEGREARNASMVAVAVALCKAGHRVTCYAFPDRDSVGTWKCVRLMQRAGFTVFGPDGKQVQG